LLTVAAACLLSIFLVIVLGLLVFVDVGIPVLVLVTLLAAPGVVGLGFGVLGARAARAAITPALDEAWLAVTSDITHRLGGEADAVALADKLGIQEAQAEELLTQLEVAELAKPLQSRIERLAPPTPSPLLQNQEDHVVAYEEASAADGLSTLPVMGSPSAYAPIRPDVGGPKPEKPTQ
jgi:hypothetical protein